MKIPYRGRFAPSPSGPLHAGSLVAALGSYLDARAAKGSWLVRIEDIDPPREVHGASDLILRQLEAHGLNWDEDIRYQSKQSSLYADNLSSLQKQSLLYGCNCSRQQIKARAPYYTGYCRKRNLPLDKHAVRLVNHTPVHSFNDRIQGCFNVDPEYAAEDFILKRRDGLWAYQLAVVSDDREQGITHIVRGSDLLIPSAWQLTLWQALNQVSQKCPLPALMHLPLVLGSDGRKLSKQNHAPPLSLNKAATNLSNAIQQLGMELPDELINAPVDEQLTWAIPAWRTTYAENFTD